MNYWTNFATHMIGLDVSSHWSLIPFRTLLQSRTWNDRVRSSNVTHDHRMDTVQWRIGERRGAGPRPPPPPLDPAKTVIIIRWLPKALEFIFVSTPTHLGSGSATAVVGYRYVILGWAFQSLVSLVNTKLRWRTLVGFSSVMVYEWKPSLRRADVTMMDNFTRRCKSCLDRRVINRNGEEQWSEFLTWQLINIRAVE